MSPVVWGRKVDVKWKTDRKHFIPPFIMVFHYTLFEDRLPSDLIEIVRPRRLLLTSISFLQSHYLFSIMWPLTFKMHFHNAYSRQSGTTKKQCTSGNRPPARPRDQEKGTDLQNIDKSTRPHRNKITKEKRVKPPPSFRSMYIPISISDTQDMLNMLKEGLFCCTCYNSDESEGSERKS